MLYIQDHSFFPPSPSDRPCHWGMCTGMLHHN